MPELTVASSGVKALLEFAVSRGADRRALTQLAGLDTAAIEERDGRIPFPRYVALMRAAQELCSDPALALHFGAEVDTSEISFSHQIGAPSLTEALGVVNRYAPLTVEVEKEGSDRYVLSHIGGQLWMIDTRKNANEFPELTESSFARMVCTGRKLLAGKSMVKSVHVTHAEPVYREDYDDVFRVPVIFGSDKNALLLDDAVLSFKPPTTPAYVAELLREHAEGLLEQLESSKSARGRVERLLVTRLTDGDVRMEAVASELGYSRQTLFRRLKSEDVTFEKVLDDLRHRLALHYLNGGRKSINQTAYLIGFSDPAAFSRAFKRWTGSSPRTHVSAHR